ncbi:MAG: response regulator transcription factor [Beijerinckiaceae bacterium]
MPSSEPIRVMIVEDQHLIRRAFRTMLSLEDGIEIVAEAGDGQEAIRLARLSRPDVVLMDLQMPKLGGVAATRAILAERPATRVIVLTTFDNDEMVFDAIGAGASAYLLKDAEESDILAAIRGQARLSPPIAEKLMDELRRTRRAEPASGAEAGAEPLTDRENAVLALVAAGYSNKQIAAELKLAEGTVKNYVSRIMDKTGARSRTDLAVRAIRGGRQPS